MNRVKAPGAELGLGGWGALESSKYISCLQIDSVKNVYFLLCFDAHISKSNISKDDKDLDCFLFELAVKYVHITVNSYPDILSRNFLFFLMVYRM